MTTSALHEWNSASPYNDYSNYVRRTFGARVQKVSINAGFTCPNRDGTKGVGGCAFCNNSTFNPDYCNPEKTITQQIDEGIRFFAPKYKTMRYLAYFQAYSNTYGATDRVIALYREALRHPLIEGLVIGTRPDCIAEDLLDATAELAKRHYIAIELGAETRNDVILSQINRCHTWADTLAAVDRIARRKLRVGLHFIMGLPGESVESQLSTATVVSSLPIESVKLHQLQIVRGSQYAKQYAENPELFTLWNSDDYIDFCVNFAERLSPNIVIERFVSQAPRELVVAPQWDLKNYEFVHRLERRFRERDTWQGRLRAK